MGTRTYDDTAITDAVAAARSWRGVLRHLGLNATSAGSIRSVRRHADSLGLDYRHFSGQRRWSDADLAAAIAAASTWSDVMVRLGLAGGSSAAALKGHALRRGIDTTHLSRPTTPEPRFDLVPDPTYLPRAGTMLAAAWFAICGFEVSWPLEPCRYDLIVVRPDAGTVRIQVKTARAKRGVSWVTSLSTSQPHGARHVYDPDDIDCFFVVDGDLRCYLIPIAAVGGQTAASLSRYEQYRLPPLGLGSGAAGSTA